MSKPKILLVEDDKNLGFVVSDNLEQAGFDVTLCKDGLEAENSFANHSFDI